MARNTHVTVGSTTPAVAADWSDSNVPWAYTDTAVFTERWPVGTNIVDIQTGSSDFWTNLTNTVSAAGGRCVVRLGEGAYSLKSFRLIGGSGDPSYSFGFWFPNLQGFLGQGADKTFVQMDADSMSVAQLDKLKTMKTADFSPNQMGLCRLDGTDPAKPVLLSGVTFRADDQNPLTSVGAGLSVTVPQSAPHQGVVIYSGAYYQISHCRFQGAGKAINSQPPFEHAGLTTQYGIGSIYNTEFDGRRSPVFDAAQTRACGVVMFGNETYQLMQDCWMHHSNVSRYAANDENRDTSGEYILTRCRLNQITNTHNEGRGGWTNATACGWESCSGTITVNDCHFEQNNPFTDGQIAQHFQLTSVGGRNPQGGRMFVNGGTFVNTGFPALDGWVCMRVIGTTYWALDGYATTINVTPDDGVRRTAWQYVGAWPPTAGAMIAAGVSKETHYLVRDGS